MRPLTPPERPCGVPLLTAGVVVLAALGWAYASTLAGLARRWLDDPQTSHGFFVPVLAGLVWWARRDRCPAWRPSAWGLPVLLAAGAARLAGVYFHLEWFDGASLVAAAGGAAVLLGGPRVGRWALPGVALLGFMVPLPYNAELAVSGPLQTLATRAGAYALQTLGYPAVAEGNVLLLDEHKIGVLEACNGLGLLGAFVAVAATAALLVNRPWPERVLIVASAVPVAVLTNLVRVTATGVFTAAYGGGPAQQRFHDAAGWAMMPAALGLLWLELRLFARLFVPRGGAGPVPVPHTTPGAAACARRRVEREHHPC